MEKLSLTVDRRATWTDVQMFFDSAKTCAPDTHITSLRERYPFLPQSYTSLLSKYDGLDIHWFVFFGSGQSLYPSVDKICSRWCDRFNIVSACPFAEDAGGNPLFLQSDGTIQLYWADTAGLESKKLCFSFDELMEDGFFGPKYTQILHGRDWMPKDDTSWVGYLKKAGWY
jgi:hypothetical protein